MNAKLQRKRGPAKMRAQTDVEHVRKMYYRSLFMDSNLGTYLRPLLRGLLPPREARAVDNEFAKLSPDYYFNRTALRRSRR